jgi:hypothetical protein
MDIAGLGGRDPAAASRDAGTETVAGAGPAGDTRTVGTDALEDAAFAVAGVGVIGCPQEPQNRAPCSISTAQCGQ